MFGYWKAYPESAKAGWGARAILNQGKMDIPYDRQSSKGGTDYKKILFNALNGGILLQVEAKLQELYLEGKVQPDKEEELELFNSDDIRVVGNTNASFGYFYILAYIK